jgi:hypothetical protein
LDCFLFKYVPLALAIAIPSACRSLIISLSIVGAHIQKTRN